MRDETPELELKIERFFTRLWKSIIGIEKYLTTKPKNKFELMDKHILIAEIISFVMLGVAIFFRVWR